MDSKPTLERRRSLIWKAMATAFKRVVRQHCETTGDTEADVAEVFNCSPTYLNNMTNSTAPVPADLLVQTVRHLGDAHAVQELCRLAGGVYVPAPSGVDIELVSVRRALREFSELVEAVCDALEDGRVTPEEAERVEREGAEAVQAIYALIHETAERSRQTHDGRARTLADADAGNVTPIRVQRRERRGE